jgi:hypothetical protein
MPTTTSKMLDKYEITAGRYRTFITAAGPNIRDWVTKYAAANPTSQLAKAVAAYPVFLDLYPAAERFDNMSLTAHLSFDIDNYNGSRGCYNGEGDFSANTYWQDDVHLKDFGLPTRALARSITDEKPMNCAMPIMFTAFCAWDGGELATLADYAEIWPAAQDFPFGPTNLCTEPGGLGEPGKYMPCNAYNWCNGGYENGGFKCQNLSLAVNGEPGVFYEYPLGTDRSKDNEPLIAAPGRFTQDETAIKSGGEGWRDVFANLGEYTGDLTPRVDPPPDGVVLTTFCDMSAGAIAGKPTCTRAGREGQTGTLYEGIPQSGVVGSTWEGHQYGHGSANSTLPATFSYGKFGGRCVRPVKAY